MTDIKLPATSAAPSNYIPYSCVQVIRETPSRSISSLRWSCTGQLLGAANSDGSVFLYKQDTLQQQLQSPTTTAPHYTQQHKLENLHDLGINDLAFSHDTKYLATAPDDRMIGLWNVETGQPLRLLKGHTHNVLAVSFNPTSTLLISGSADETVRIWDLKSGKCIRSLLAHSDPVTGIDINRDGSLIVSGSYDGLVRVWDVNLGQCLKTIYVDKIPPVSAVKFSPNGKFVLASTLDSKLRLWDYEHGKCLKLYESHVNSKYCCFSSFATTGTAKLVVTGSEDGAAYVYDVQSRKLLQRLQHQTELTSKPSEQIEEQKSGEISNNASATSSSVVIATAAHPTQNIIATGAMEPSNVVNIWYQQPAGSDASATTPAAQSMDTS